MAIRVTQLATLTNQLTTNTNLRVTQLATQVLEQITNTNIRATQFLVLVALGEPKARDAHLPLTGIGA